MEKTQEMIQADFEQLKKDIEIVSEWRKSGKTLNKDEQAFAERIVDRMIDMKNSNRVGVQLVKGSNMRFLKGMQPVQGSDAVAPITQDAVSSGTAKDGKFPRKIGVKKEEVEKSAKPKSDKQPSLKEAAPHDGDFPKKTPDVQNIKQNCPDNCSCGEVSAVADTKIDPKVTSSESSDKDISVEAIGHQPNLPMPKGVATDLIQNAKWGVEIGVYTNLKEGIERQLGRKDYAEFVDTEDKLKDVQAYLLSLVPDTKPEPVA